MQIIDLSLPIDDSAPEVHPFWIERITHKQGIAHLNKVLSKRGVKKKIRPQDFPAKEFLSLETLHCPVHIGTHIDFSYHFGSKYKGKAAKKINELPLEWCISTGVVLDVSHRKAGEEIIKKDILIALEKINYQLKPLDIVLLRTGCDKYFGKKEYLEKFPGVNTEALKFILNKNIKIVGIDTAGFDRPYKFMLADFLRTNNPAYLWPIHFLSRKYQYAHIERLANLYKLPKPFGFKLACFPIKIKDVGASWSRVVAIID